VGDPREVRIVSRAQSCEQTLRENKAYSSYDDQETYSGEEEQSWWKPLYLSVIDMLRDAAIKLQMEHLGAAVRGATEPLLSISDEFRNLHITEAITQAAASGGAVEIDSQ
jgi:hypothetical protein